MPALGPILLATFLGSVAALLAGAWMLWREKWARRVSGYLLAFATGALLVAALLDLLPEAIEAAEERGVAPQAIFGATLAGLLAFFVIERYLIRVHSHDDPHQEDDGGPPPPTRNVAWMVLGGDAVHNFVDGVIIAATFLAGTDVGIVATIAVFAHEVPQEVGDFGVMLYAGFSRAQILGLNLLTALTAFAGALGAYALGQVASQYLWAALGFAAGVLLYIATADLLPELKRERHHPLFSGMSLSFFAGLVGMLATIQAFR